MNPRVIAGILSGADRSWLARGLRQLLHVTSWMYAGVISLRNRLYDSGIFPATAVEVPVVSIGNLTTGGTGKTPLVAWTVRFFAALGMCPAILSRGYRALDSTNEAASASRTSGNDEKRVLERLCPKVPHLQNRDRISGARSAIDQFQADVLILDDGLQHRRLHRDLEIVVIDALNPWGYGHLLPRGLLREPPMELRRANVVLVTRANQATGPQRQQLRDEIRQLAPQAVLAEVAFVPRSLINHHAETKPWDVHPPGSLGAFCGIGNPEGFRKFLEPACSAEDLVIFPDHHHYSPVEIQQLAQQFAGKSAVLTTEKDFVKIPENQWTGPPLWFLDLGVEFLSGQPEFEAALLGTAQSSAMKCQEPAARQVA